MLPPLVATGAEISFPITIRQLIVVRRMGIMAACAVNKPPCDCIDIGALEHPVSVGPRDLLMTLQAKLLQVLVQQFRLSPGMGQMAGIAAHLRGSVLELLAHHFLPVAIITKIRGNLHQERICRARVGGVTAQALPAGEGRVMARLPLHCLFFLFVAVPAKVGDLFDKLR